MARRAYERRYSSRYDEKRERAYDYYAYGSYAKKLDAKILEEKKDNISLKYYGKATKAKNRAQRKVSAQKIFCALIVCLSAIAIVFANSLVYNYQVDNQAFINKLENAKYETETVLAESTGEIDLAHIEYVATTRLNMVKPQSYQIVYIEVPKTDYTVMHEPPLIIEKERFTIGKVNNVLNNFKESSKEIIMKPKETKVDAYDN